MGLAWLQPVLAFRGCGAQVEIQRARGKVFQQECTVSSGPDVFYGVYTPYTRCRRDTMLTLNWRAALADEESRSVPPSLA